MKRLNKVERYEKDSNGKTTRHYWSEENGNKPVFDANPRQYIVKFTELDDFGRCGPAYACLDNSKVTLGARIKREADCKKEGTGTLVVNIIDKGIEDGHIQSEIETMIKEKTGLDFKSLNVNDFSLEKYSETKRGDINTIYPTGWIQEKYPGVISGSAREGEEGNAYLYQRAHLLRHALTQINSEPRNLVTGTQWLNTVDMLDCEDEVLNFILDNPGVYVQYRVTPLFDKTDLTPYAIQMEALSEDGRLSFNRIIPNMEPGILIDYATGRSRIE